MRRARRSGGIRVLLVTQYYAPEVGAAQTRLRETARGLLDRGFRVTVIAPVPSYPLGLVPEGYDWWRPRRERIDGARVARLPTIAIAGAGMSRRLIGHLAFAMTSVTSVAIAGRFDVALIESPPLLLAFAARVLRARGLPYVYHVADPWPDFPIAMGYLQTPAERAIAFGIEDLAYRNAAAITTVSPGLVELLSRKPSAAGRVELIPNGVQTDRFLPDRLPPTSRAALGWEETFTIVYAGTVGLAQGIGTLLEAARLLGPGVRIRIVGEGVERPALEARARDLDLRGVSFHPSVSREEVPAILAAADAGLVILRRGPLYEESLPTKLLETMAAGRPVIVGADGLTARIVEEAGAGYVAAAEASGALARAIDACRLDPERQHRGAAGRAYVTEHYERSAILDRLAEVIAGAAVQR
jgi:colanic acid biosynthesis glycosyl transferase WcaI